MSRSTEGGSTSTSEARARLLNTATRIFYTEGIHSVGIDRIVAEAQVTRATL
ncbi:TetR family transcriptional regulator, partial [Actinacidiphila glaucinigra]